jgi:hypothetical protein
MARHPDSFPTVTCFSILPVSRNPNAIILVIILIIITIRGIRSVIVISNWRRRGYKENRGADKESKVGTAIMGVPVSVPMPGPG